MRGSRAGVGWGIVRRAERVRGGQGGITVPGARPVCVRRGHESFMVSVVGILACLHLHPRVVSRRERSGGRTRTTPSPRTKSMSLLRLTVCGRGRVR